jgi:hypothetical protein
VPTTQNLCTVCGRQTPWHDLTPVWLTAAHGETRTGAACPSCLIDIDGATAAHLHHQPLHDVYITIDDKNWKVTRR